MQLRLVNLSVATRATLFVSLAMFGALMSGCGTGFKKGFPSQISAPVTSLRVTQTVQLKNESSITGSAMTYWVNGMKGGNDTVGTIDSTGLYTAPTITPLPENTVTITSLADKFPSDTPGSVAVSILNPIPIITTVNPGSLTEGSPVVEVSGSEFVYGAQIIWKGVPVPTTYVSGTKLAAVISAPNPGKYPLTVRNPDPGSADATVLNEKVGPGQVVLTFQTGQGTSVRVNNSLSVGISVAGTNNTGVSWFLNGLTTGNPAIGTIVPNPDGSVTYTAPAVVPTPSNLVQLTAISVDNPKVYAMMNVAVDNPIPILNAATPMAFDPGTSTVVLSGSRFIPGAQVLVNGRQC